VKLPKVLSPYLQQYHATLSNILMHLGTESTLIMGSGKSTLSDSFCKVKVASTTTRMTAKVLSEISVTHGFPGIIVSDSDPQFNSDFADFLF